MKTQITDVELNIRVVKEIFGWKEIQPPKYDVDGKLPNQGKVLAPPDFNESQYIWPNRGVAPYTFFINQSYVDDIKKAMKVVLRMHELGFSFRLATQVVNNIGLVYSVTFSKEVGTKTHDQSASSTDAAKSICLAALGLSDLT